MSRSPLETAMFYAVSLTRHRRNFEFMVGDVRRAWAYNNTVSRNSLRA